MIWKHTCFKRALDLSEVVWTLSLDVFSCLTVASSVVADTSVMLSLRSAAASASTCTTARPDGRIGGRGREIIISY